jgi:hypothetical protein
MGTATLAAKPVRSRWNRANDTSRGIGLMVPALALLAPVIAVELMGLVMVIQGHVVEAGICERIRASTPVTASVAGRL